MDRRSGAAKTFEAHWIDPEKGLRKDALGCYFAPQKSSKCVAES
jgi:hypothetical protein